MTDRRRWWALAVACLSVLLATFTSFAVTVALPTLVRELHATTSELQLIVAASFVMGTSLMVVGGSLGDRFGRVKMLRVGLVLFGAASALGAWAQNPTTLIACRALMGIGTALMFPSGMSIITSLFRVPAERSRAIGIWAAASSLGFALGPLVGGLLLSQFWWGSVFLVNVPVVLVALVLSQRIPESSNPHPPQFDPLGVLLVVASMSALVEATTRAPNEGWGAPVTLATYVTGLALLACFVAWELRCDHPLLELGFFRNPRFTAANACGITGNVAFVGSLFVLTQLLQFVYGYSPLAAGIRLLPLALGCMLASLLSHRVAHHLGTKRTVALGLSAVATALVVVLSTIGPDAGYGSVGVAMAAIGAGFGLLLAPATESVMGSVPHERAGLASGMSITTHQMGAAFGVAIFGSLLASGYQSVLTARTTGLELSSHTLTAARASLGDALKIASNLDGAARKTLTDAARAGFVHGMNLAMATGAAILLLGAALALRYLPSRARETPEATEHATLVIPTD